MIHAIHIEKPHKNLCPWWSSVYPQPITFEFKPGLNLLLGPNGSGKSTLLGLLAKLTMCEQAGMPLYSEGGIRPFLRVDESNLGLRIVTDGTHARYFKGGSKPGSAYGSFDWDAIGADEKLLGSLIAKRSNGQMQIGHLNRLILDATNEVKRSLNPDHCNSTWSDAFLTVQKLNEASGPLGPPTILLDEPDQSLDIPNQILIWDWFSKLAETNQLVIATHNVLAMRLPAHRISLTEDHLNKCERMFKVFQERNPQVIHEASPVDKV